MTTPSTPAFSPEQQAWYEKACQRIDPQRLQKLLFSIVDIHSPTGAARAASEFMARHLAEVGLKARYQPMTDTSGNVLAELRGSGGGASLMLYAPIDTHLDLTEAESEWTGARGEADMQPRAQSLGDWVFGLGASNPKAMVATLTEIEIGRAHV